jgi:serine/threonine-protein kinase RsbW
LEGESLEMRRIVKTKNQISIPSSLDYLKDVDEFVEGKLKRIGLSESELADVAISVTEAVTNAIVHGNKNDEDKKVEVTLRVKEPDLVVWVKDQGEGFDPGAVPNPVNKDNILKKVGRGIFILKSLMDDVDFEFQSEGGTLVKMVKRFKAAKKSQDKRI